MLEGISLEEACANNAIGTQEDFERICNPDGTVKAQPKTTTITLKNDDTKLMTVDNTFLYIAFVSVSVALVLLAILFIFKKIKNKFK